MTMQTEITGSAGSAEGFGFFPYFRIAIPSWRFSRAVSIASEPKSPTLSREEIVRIFDGDLKEIRRRRRKLTELEESEQALSSRIRSALYSA